MNITGERSRPQAGMGGYESVSEWIIYEDVPDSGQQTKFEIESCYIIGHQS